MRANRAVWPVWPVAVVVLLLSAGRASADAAGRERIADCGALLRPLLESRMAELRVPGAIIDVDVPGLCRWRAAVGSEDVEGRTPMRLDEHVRIGSITKTFTGTVVLELVDEQQVGLDDPVSRYVDGVPGGDAITVRQLLHMTSGLYNYSEDPAFNRSIDEDQRRVWTVPELLAIAFRHEPYFPPGAGFHYSNTNTLLLGQLIEKVTGRTLAEEFQERIFEPLRMTETRFPDPADALIPEPHPRGYMFGTNVGSIPPACDAAEVGIHDVTEASPSWAGAAGGAISTERDLILWARALAQGALLSPATQAERLEFVRTGPPPGGAGYGLHIAQLAGFLGHDGALPGFQSFEGYLPSRNATLVVLTNLYPDVECGSPADALARLIATKLQLAP